MCDEWAILERYEAWEKTCPPSLLSYARAFKVELIEIIAQLEGQYPLAGYKLQPKLSNWKKWKIISKRLLGKPASLCVAMQEKVAHNATLLFVLEYAGHYKQLAPIAAQLTHQKIHFQVVFLRQDLFERHHAEFEYAIYLAVEDHWYCRFKSLKIIWMLRKNKGFRALVHPDNRQPWRLESLFLNAKLLAAITGQQVALGKLLSKIPNAQVVFFKSEGCRIKSLINTCKAQNRRVIAIQHGLIKHELKYTDLPTDVYLTWSEYFSQALTSSRAGCETVAIGCPNFDAFFQLRSQTSSKPNPQNLRLLFLPNSGNSQTPRSELKFAIGLCLEFVRTRDHISLIIKPHPGDHSCLLADMVFAAGLKERVTILSRNAPIPYADCDIVATMNSTTGIEAAIFGKPLLIVLSDSKYIMVEEYLTLGIARWCYSLPALEEAVEEILADYPIFQMRTAVFIDQFLSNSGQSTKVVCEYLLRG